MKKIKNFKDKIAFLVRELFFYKKTQKNYVNFSGPTKTLTPNFVKFSDPPFILQTQRNFRKFYISLDAEFSELSENLVYL